MVNTEQFKQEKNAPKRQYLDLKTTLRDADGIYITNDFFRVYRLHP